MVMGWFDSLFGDDSDDAAEQRKPRDPLGRIPPEPEFDAFRSAWKAGAGLFDLFGDEPLKIKSPVGPEAPNLRPDVAKIETFLGRTGHLDLAKTEGPIGYYGSRIDQGIRGFQKDNALKIDGLINPDGPTLGTLRSLLREDGNGAIARRAGPLTAVPLARACSLPMPPSARQSYSLCPWPTASRTGSGDKAPPEREAMMNPLGHPAHRRRLYSSLPLIRPSSRNDPPDRQPIPARLSLAVGSVARSPTRATIRCRRRSTCGARSTAGGGRASTTRPTTSNATSRAKAASFR
jgi:hypothetical protein